MSCLRVGLLGAVIAIALSGGQTASAGEYSSPWQNNPYARARLITTGYPVAHNTSVAGHAGIQIELDPGWKTYWRIPGDSGIPPQVIWAGSLNVEAIEIRWPTPHRFIDEYGMSIGYKNEIVLPVKIIPKDKTAPIHLALELNYAVCSDICLPASAKMTLDIQPGTQKPGPFKRKLQRFVDQVPKIIDTSPGLKVQNLEISNQKQQIILSFDVENPEGDALVDVFIEGDDNLFFGTPKNIVNQGQVSHVDVVVSGAKSVAALKGNRLRFTLVGKKSSVDQYWTIGG